MEGEALTKRRRGWDCFEAVALTWTQRLGVSRQTVNAIENGKYDPSLRLAFGIARLFELQIEDVFDPDHSETAASAAGRYLRGAARSIRAW